MYEVKTKPTDENVVKFLEQVEDPQKRSDSFEILELMHEITGEHPILWGSSIIGFGTINYKNKSGFSGDSMKIGFSPRKQNLTIYAMTGWERFSELFGKLGKHKLGKGCLYLNKLEQVDKSVLREILEKAYNTPLSFD